LGSLHYAAPGLGFGVIVCCGIECGKLAAKLGVAAGIAVAADDRLDFLRPRRSGLGIDERDQRVLERQRELGLHAYPP